MQLQSILLFTCALFCSSCGTTSTATIDVKTVETTSFAFEDKRPSKQRASGKEILGNSVTTTLGDEAIIPPSPKLVRTWLQQSLAAPLQGKQVELRNFITEIVEPGTAGIDEGRFASSVATVPGANPLSALLARGLIGGIESAKNTKTVRVEIEVAVNGKAIYVRWSEKYQGRVTERNVNEVIQKILDILVQHLRTGL